MPGITNLGPWPVSSGGFQVRDGVRYFSGASFPKSGTAGTGIDRDGHGAPTGSVYVHKSSGVAFINEGTVASPYWTPMSFQQRGLLGYHCDFRDGVGIAVSDTAATYTVAGSGLRIFGLSKPDTDAGLTVALDSNGAVGSLITGNEDNDSVALSFGVGTTAIYKASTNGTIAFDTLVTQNTAITARAMFFGFCASAADALTTPVTYATETISFAATSGDEVAGLFFSTDGTTTNRWFAPHDKGNTNASILTTATGVNTGVDVAAAATYQRLRVELDSNGTVRMFIDKALVATFAAAITTTTAVEPALVLATNSVANVQADIKHISAWGVRP